MSGPQVSRWSRRFVGTGALCFVAWALAALLTLGRRVEILLALYGFVLLTVFGKSYALLPSYFDRTLAVPRAPGLQFSLSVGAVLALAVGTLPGVPAFVTMAGALAWFLGVLVWVGALGWTVRDNITGSETGTGDHQADRRSIDRLSNGAVPLVALYALTGSYELFAGATGLPTLLGGVTTRVSHMLGAGGATLLVFAVGYRLFPRFLVARPPRSLVALVLTAGAVGPAVIAAGLYDRFLLTVGFAFEGTAIVGFAFTYLLLSHRSDRSRVGLQTVLVAVVAGLVTVVLAGYLAFLGRPSAIVRLHYRFALVGFLGLTIVGAAVQFYPPSVGQWPGADDRTALASVSLVAGGLALQIGGLVVAWLTTLGALAALAGAALYAYVLASAFAARG